MDDDDRFPMALVDHRYDSQTPLAIAVVRSIAAVDDTDPTALVREHDRTLYDSVDPDALNALATSASDAAEFEVTFTLYGYRVRIRDDSRILLYEDD